MVHFSNFKIEVAVISCGFLTSLILKFIFYLYLLFPKNESINKIYKTGKILCIMTTYGKNNYLIDSINNTWISKCDKVVFVSKNYARRFELIDTFAVKQIKGNLWNRIRKTFENVHDYYLYEYDWYLKIDDDTYVIVENVKRFLRYYDPNKPYYFGKYVFTFYILIF